MARASIGLGEASADSFGEEGVSCQSFSGLLTLLEVTERQYLQDVVLHTEGNMKEACRISGLSRSRFYARLKKYGIRRQA